MAGGEEEKAGGTPMAKTRNFLRDLGCRFLWRDAGGRRWSSSERRGDEVGAQRLARPSSVLSVLVYGGREEGKVEESQEGEG